MQTIDLIDALHGLLTVRKHDAANRVASEILSSDMTSLVGTFDIDAYQEVVGPIPPTLLSRLHLINAATRANALRTL